MWHKKNVRPARRQSRTLPGVKFVKTNIVEMDFVLEIFALISARTGRKADLVANFCLWMGMGDQAMEPAITLSAASARGSSCKSVGP